jgi:hypothetical protein
MMKGIKAAGDDELIDLLSWHGHAWTDKARDLLLADRPATAPPPSTDEPPPGVIPLHQGRR